MWVYCKTDMARRRVSLPVVMRRLFRVLVSGHRLVLDVDFLSIKKRSPWENALEIGNWIESVI